MCGKNVANKPVLIQELAYFIIFRAKGISTTTYVTSSLISDPGLTSGSIVPYFLYTVCSLHISEWTGVLLHFMSYFYFIMHVFFSIYDTELVQCMLLV